MNLSNHFLLPMPTIAGDYFADTLTLVCEHDDQGAMGLVVNKPTQVSLYELIGEIGGTPHRALLDQPVYDGGPVDAQRGFVLHDGQGDVTDSARLMSGLYLSTSADLLTSLTANEGSGSDPGSDPRFIFALGYAGWGAGQLESEITNNVWLTVPAEAELIFACPAHERLRRAAATLGIDLSLVANPGHA